MRLIGLCAVALFASGCISHHIVQSEEKFSAPPVLSRVCAYAWQYDATLPHVKQLFSGCPRPEPERTAKLSVYYREHKSTVLPFDREHTISNIAFGFTAAMLHVLTLGVMPFPYFKKHVACVQATSADGLNRFAIAEGKITLLMNTWSVVSEVKGLKPPPVETRITERRAELLQDLTSQAWHKLWLLHAENLGAEDCRQIYKAK